MNRNLVSRRQVLKSAGLGSVAALLAACQQPTATPAPTPAPMDVQATLPAATAVPTAAPAKESVVLNFVRPGAGDDAMQEVEAQMKPFYEKHPEIKLETLVVLPPDIGTKLQTSVAGGAPPDLAMIPASYFIKFAQGGQLLDLTPLTLQDGFDWEAFFYPIARDPFIVNGKLYGVCESASTDALAYNKNLFDAASVPYPTNDWTWDDMLAAAQDLTKEKDGSIDIWGLSISTDRYRPWMWMNGGDLFNQDFTECTFTDPKTIEAMQFLADLRNKYKVSPPQEVRKAFPQESFMFLQNKVAMHLATWSPETALFFPDIKDFTWDVVHTPKNPQTGLRSCQLPAWAVSAFAATKHAQEVYEVWRWMTSDEGLYHRFVDKGGKAPIPNGPADKWPIVTEAFAKIDSPPSARVFLEAMEYARTELIPRDNEAEIFNAMSPMMDEMWMGSKTAAEVASLIKQAVDPLLK